MRVITYLILIFTFFSNWAQVNYEIDLEHFAEKRFQLQDEDLNYEDLYESLLLYYTTPLDLNRASREELASLYILNPAQLNAFFEYRSDYGKIISIYELQAIPEFDLGTVYDLLPFVTVQERTDSRSLLQRIMQEENNYLLLRYTRRFPSAEGFDEDRENGYLGDPNVLYGRFRISRAGDFSLGATVEKDAGEEFDLNAEDEQYGFDYYSFHFQAYNQGIFKTLAVGDYQLQFGQGLVLGSGFGSGKGAEPITTIKRNSVGIRPYASVIESGFFRGAASTMKFNKIEITTFGSSLRQDANILTDTTYSDFDEFVNSIQSTGLHRTRSELSAKNSIREHSLGYALVYNSGSRFKIGSTGLYSYYSRPLQKKPNNYNQFEFQGDRNNLHSVFANYNREILFFSEKLQEANLEVGGRYLGLWPLLILS